MLWSGLCSTSSILMKVWVGKCSEILASSRYSADPTVNKDVIMTNYFDVLSKYNETKNELCNRHLYGLPPKSMSLAGTNEGSCMKY